MSLSIPVQYRLLGSGLVLSRCSDGWGKSGDPGERREDVEGMENMANTIWV